MRIPTSLCFFALLTSVTAQSVTPTGDTTTAPTATTSSSLAAAPYIFYPQETTSISSGNIIPFGAFTNQTNFDEGRSQFLIPREQLPSRGAALTGLSAVSHTYSGAMTYQSFKVTISESSATSLSTTFATNLPTPTVVLNQTNFSITWGTRAWSGFAFTTPFVYSGTANLVIDIQKVYNRTTNPLPTAIITHQRNGNPSRADLPRFVYDFGPGTATSTTARFNSDVMSLRIDTAGTPTLAILSDRDPTTGNVFSINTSFSLSSYGAVGSQYVTLIDGAWAPAPISLPFIQGFGYVTPLNLFPPGTITASPDVRSLMLPNDPSSVGAQLVFQNVVVESGRLVWTNGVDCRINN